MRQHLMTVVLVGLIVTTLFTVWLVQFFAAQFEQSLSGQLSEVHGLVEFQTNSEEWQTAFPGQRVNPGMHLRVTADSSAILTFNATSRLSLEPETELRYLGYVNGQPSWLLLGGVISGQYVSTAKPLLITIDESTIAATVATFKAVNTLDEQSVTVYDQSVTVSSTQILEASEEKIQPVIVSAGETYHLVTGDGVVADMPLLPAPTPIIEPENTASAAASPAGVSPQSPEIAVEVTDEIKLTVGQANPLTFVWVDQSIQNSSAKNTASFRIFRGTKPDLDETSASAYRTVTGQNLTSFMWALPDEKNTYYFRVCRLTGTACAVYSNTLHFVGSN